MIDKAREALKKYQDIEYTISTTGYQYILEQINKELQSAFRNSRSPEFAKDVKDKPETYFKHIGYCEGLECIKSIIDRARVAGVKAKKDIEKWESKNNQAL